MKTLSLVFLCMSIFLSSKGQDKNLTGTWNLISWTNIADSVSAQMTEDQLIANNQITEYSFLEEGKFKMTTNMAGSGSMDNYEGSWKASENKLIITLKLGEQNIDLENIYELKDNNLILTRIIPENNVKIINTFRKKV